MSTQRYTTKRKKDSGKVTTKRTPTDTLMRALEEFGVDEPTECIVIFQTQGGDICTISSTDTVSTKVGMLETAKHWQLNKFKELSD